jgi:hypothetical protein
MYRIFLNTFSLEKKILQTKSDFEIKINKVLLKESKIKIDKSEKPSL